MVIFYIFFLLSLYTLVLSSPKNFPHYSTVRIETGSGLSQTALLLQKKQIVRSPFWFKSFAVLLNGSRSVRAGDYYFNEKEGAFRVARRIIQGQYGLVPLRVTIPEGFSIFQMAPIFKEKFTFFDEKRFLQNSPEGFLFPDTYFFLPNVTAEDIALRMKRNFDERTESIRKETASSSISFSDLIILASILEKEAVEEKDKRLIAGVIYNRLTIGMPLQVDATFSYVNGKNTYTLTRADLREDSPYNTYLYKGLPPTPIANPGIKSIEAALRPAETKYLYFLSDLSGKMYYAKDFEGHQINREKYLRR